MIRQLVSCGIVIVFVLGLFASSSAQDQPKVATLDVTGRGVIMADPNMATITFSVETSEKKAADALENNARITKRLMEVLKGAAKAQATITTSNFSVYPLYDENTAPRETKAGISPRGFRVTNSVIVRTSGIDEVGLLIDSAAAAGANRIGSLSFGRSDQDQMQKQAAAKAIENALELGEELARAAGLRVSRIVHIQHVSAGPVPEYREMAFAEARTPTPIAPGQIPVESYVQVSFELKQ